jgi:hypothetical protein
LPESNPDKRIKVEKKKTPTLCAFLTATCRVGVDALVVVSGRDLSHLDRDFLYWNADLLGDWGPNIHALGLRFDTDNKGVPCDRTAVTLGLILPPSGDGVYADPATFS